MPVTRRSRKVSAPPEEVWATVGDPRHLARWWPRVERVEGVAHDGFTKVLRSDKGARVRADFRIVDRHGPRRVRWAQELEDTPFERLFRSAETTVELEPAGGGGTLVRIRLDQKLQGIARLGGFLVRRATGRQLDDALDALARLHGDHAT